MKGRKYIQSRCIRAVLSKLTAYYEKTQLRGHNSTISKLFVVSTFSSNLSNNHTGGVLDYSMSLNPDVLRSNR